MPRVVAPSLKVTVPVGVPLAPVTVAVKVTDCPTVDGFEGRDERRGVRRRAGAAVGDVFIGVGAGRIDEVERRGDRHINEPRRMCGRDTGERDGSRSNRRRDRGAAGGRVAAESHVGQQREPDQPATLGTVIVTVWPPATGPWFGTTVTLPPTGGGPLPLS